MCGQCTGSSGSPLSVPKFVSRIVDVSACTSLAALPCLQMTYCRPWQTVWACSTTTAGMQSASSGSKGPIPRLLRMGSSGAGSTARSRPCPCRAMEVSAHAHAHLRDVCQALQLLCGRRTGLEAGNHLAHEHSSL